MTKKIRPLRVSSSLVAKKKKKELSRTASINLNKIPYSTCHGRYCKYLITLLKMSQTIYMPHKKSSDNEWGFKIKFGIIFIVILTIKFY